MSRCALYGAMRTLDEPVWNKTIISFPEWLLRHVEQMLNAQIEIKYVSLFFEPTNTLVIIPCVAQMTIASQVVL